MPGFSKQVFDPYYFGIFFIHLVMQFSCCKLCQQIDEQYDYKQYTGDTEGNIIFTVLHLQVQLYGQGSSGCHCLASQDL